MLKGDAQQLRMLRPGLLLFIAFAFHKHKSEVRLFSGGAPPDLAATGLKAQTPLFPDHPGRQVRPEQRDLGQDRLGRGFDHRIHDTCVFLSAFLEPGKKDRT